MTRTERLRLIRIYGGLYTRHMQLGGSLCFYCGSQRECLDHRPPISTLDALGVGKMHRLKVPLVLIPSCTDCNQKLGSKPLLTAQEAAEFLLDRLERDYERRFNLWHDDEIDEMSPMFQKMIRARKVQLHELLSRVRHVQALLITPTVFPAYDEDDDL